MQTLSIPVEPGDDGRLSLPLKRLIDLPDEPCVVEIRVIRAETLPFSD